MPFATLDSRIFTTIAQYYWMLWIFDDDGDDDADDDDDDLMVSIHSTKTKAIPTQSTIDHAIKLSEEIPSNEQKKQQQQQQQRQSTDNLKSAQNVSSKLEIESSTLANAIAKKRITIFKPKHSHCHHSHHHQYPTRIPITN